MEPLELAKKHFHTIAMELTDKSRRSLATAIGLAGAVNGCDESFVSIGLRKSNSALAHLTDHFRLDFDKPDEETAQHTEYKENEIIRDELRRQGFNEQDVRRYIDKDDDPFIEYDGFFLADDLAADPEYDGPHEKAEFDGIEGEPDASTAEWLSNHSTPEIITRAVKSARADHRTTIETFDFIAPLPNLPITAEVFQKSRVSQHKLQRELARFRTLEPFSEQQQFVLMFSEGRLRLKTFGLLDGLKYEERTVSPQDLVVQLSADAPFISQSAIEAFEDLINWDKVSERDIHRFLETHPYFLQGDDYCSLHS